MSPRELVHNALLRLEMLRDEEGNLPDGVVDSFTFLYTAYVTDDCQNWKALGLAKGILLEDWL